MQPTQTPLDAEQIRLVVTSVLIVGICVIRSCRKKNIVVANDFIEIAWAVGGAVLTSGLAVKALTDIAFYQIIGNDGILALLVGAGSQILGSLSVELQKDCIAVWRSFTYPCKRLLSFIKQGIIKPNKPNPP